MNTSKGSSIVGVFILVVILLVVGGCTASFMGGCAPNYSNGSRVGVVSKLSNKGLIWKSWEGEMNLGGFRNTTTSDGTTAVVANIFQFSVQSEAVVTKIQEAMRAGRQVELVYREYAISPVTIETGYVVTDVR